MADNGFYLTVLSANKGRLAVREWLNVDLERLKENLENFIQAVRITEPWGSEAVSFSIPTLLSALQVGDPNLTRGLLRAAYLGYPPPRGLLEGALRRFRVPKTLRDAYALHPLSSALKLTLTFGKEEAKTMETLDEKRDIPAYLCGRLLSILEEAQRRASRQHLNSTIVDRFYTAASTSPASNLATLLNRAQSAYLPKVRKENRGYGELQGLLEEVMAQLDGTGGFPRVLSLPEQAEFALGFYHQRANFRANRRPRQ